MGPQTQTGTSLSEPAVTISKDGFYVTINAPAGSGGYDGPEDGVPPSDVVLMGSFPKGAGDHMTAPPKAPWPKTITVTEHQARALEKILEIDQTAWVSHGGLKGLLGISDSQVLALADVVEALKK